jgi:hypothetical protein
MTAPRAAPGPEVVLVVRDTADSLERVFGTVRRRAMDLRVLSLGRFGSDLVVVLRSEKSDPVPARWLAELEGLVDVHHVRVAVSPVLPEPESPLPLEGDQVP